MKRKSQGFASHLGDTAEPVLNLTSLIDVVFVVLIMFIVIAPLLDVDRIALASSTQHSPKEKQAPMQSNHIAIAVDADDNLSLNKKPLTTEQLRKVLPLMHKKYPDARPQLFHDKRAPFGTYQSIKNAVEEAGFTEMDIILIPG
jgi:biopolymer transport protein ExbD